MQHGSLHGLAGRLLAKRSKLKSACGAPTQLHLIDGRLEEAAQATPPILTQGLEEMPPQASGATSPTQSF